MPMRKPKGVDVKHGWTFLSNHSHVLICLAIDPQMRLRDVALKVGITERAVQKIVADLETGGVIERHKVGRRNTYSIDLSRKLRHPVEAHRSIRSLLELVLDGEQVATIHEI